MLAVEQRELYQISHPRVSKRDKHRTQNTEPKTPPLSRVVLHKVQFDDATKAGRTCLSSVGHVNVGFMFSL